MIIEENFFIEDLFCKGWELVKYDPDNKILVVRTCPGIPEVDFVVVEVEYEDFTVKTNHIRSSDSLISLMRSKLLQMKKYNGNKVKWIMVEGIDD